MCAKLDSAKHNYTAGKRDFLLKAGFKPKYFCNYIKVLAHFSFFMYNVHAITYT